MAPRVTSKASAAGPAEKRTQKKGKTTSSPTSVGVQKRSKKDKSKHSKKPSKKSSEKHSNKSLLHSVTITSRRSSTSSEPEAQSPSREEPDAPGNTPENTNTQPPSQQPEPSPNDPASQPKRQAIRAADARVNQETNYSPIMRERVRQVQLLKSLLSVMPKGTVYQVLINSGYKLEPPEGGSVPMPTFIPNTASIPNTANISNTASIPSANIPEPNPSEVAFRSLQREAQYWRTEHDALENLKNHYKHQLSEALAGIKQPDGGLGMLVKRGVKKEMASYKRTFFDTLGDALGYARRWVHLQNLGNAVEKLPVLSRAAPKDLVIWYCSATRINSKVFQKALTKVSRLILKKYEKDVLGRGFVGGPIFPHTELPDDVCPYSFVVLLYQDRISKEYIVEHPKYHPSTWTGESRHWSHNCMCYDSEEERKNKERHVLRLETQNPRDKRRPKGEHDKILRELNPEQTREEALADTSVPLTKSTRGRYSCGVCGMFGHTAKKHPALELKAINIEMLPRQRNCTVCRSPGHYSKTCTNRTAGMVSAEDEAYGEGRPVGPPPEVPECIEISDDEDSGDGDDGSGDEESGDEESGDEESGDEESGDEGSGDDECGDDECVGGGVSDDDENEEYALHRTEEEEAEDQAADDTDYYDDDDDEDDEMEDA